MTQQFYVSGIFETVGDKFGINIGCDGMEDDLCYGAVVSSQQTVTQFLTKHKGIYNFLMLDDIIDSVPMIRLIRRAVGADLDINAVVLQRDCIFQGEGTPTIQFNRIDPMSLPRSVELQYISYDRNFAVNTQYAFNEGARTQQAVLSVQSDFILDDATARTLAYDLLFRMWSQQLKIGFEHPDLTIEPSDIVQVETDLGTYVIQILTSMITKEPNSHSGIGRTNQLSGQLLLQRKGATINPGQVSTTSKLSNFHITAGAVVVGLAGGDAEATTTITAGATVSGVSGDPYWTSVKLLMGFEGANGATGAPGMTDESSAAHGTGIAGGGCQISTLDKKFGSSSMRSFSAGNVHYADHADWHLGSGNFTVEMFINISTSQFQFLIGQWNAIGSIGWILYLGGDNKLNWNVSTTGSDNLNDIAGSIAMTNGVWSHAALDFNGSKYRMYIDGVMAGSFSTPRTIFAPATNLVMGSNSLSTGFWYGGYMDEVRLTKGVARYASDGGFTVPTVAYPRG